MTRGEKAARWAKRGGRAEEKERGRTSAVPGAHSAPRAYFGGPENVVAGAHVARVRAVSCRKELAVKICARAARD